MGLQWSNPQKYNELYCVPKTEFIEVDTPINTFKKVSANITCVLNSFDKVLLDSVSIKPIDSEKNKEIIDPNFDIHINSATDILFPTENVIYAINTIRLISLSNQTDVDVNFQFFLPSKNEKEPYKFEKKIPKATDADMSHYLYKSDAKEYLRDFAGTEGSVTDTVPKLITDIKTILGMDNPTEYTIIKKNSLCANFIAHHGKEVQDYVKKTYCNLDILLYKLFSTSEDPRVNSHCGVALKAIVATQTYVKERILSPIIYTKRGQVKVNFEINSNDKKHLLETMLENKIVSSNINIKSTNSKVVTVRIEIEYYEVNKEKSVSEFFVQ
jgi:hypothetical protein